MSETEAKVPDRIWPIPQLWVANAYSLMEGGPDLALTAWSAPPPSGVAAFEYVTAASRDEAVREALERAAKECMAVWEGERPQFEGHDMSAEEVCAAAIRALIPGGPT